MNGNGRVRETEQRKTMVLADASEPKLALFIDFENLAIGVQDAKYKTFEIDLVLARLLEKGKVVYKRAYADWGRYAKYKKDFHEEAIEMIDIPASRISGKNSADIRLVVDAMDLCYSKDHIDIFCIASGDSDFSPLVSKLKENDKYAIGLGVKESTSDLLISNCDEFIYYEDIIRDAGRSGVPGVRVPDKKKQEAFQLLADAVKALLRENKEVLWGSMVKQTMLRKRPSFYEGYHGYDAFTDLLEDASQHGIVSIKRDVRSGTYVITGLGPGSHAVTVDSGVV